MKTKADIPISSNSRHPQEVIDSQIAAYKNLMIRSAERFVQSKWLKKNYERICRAAGLPKDCKRLTKSDVSHLGELYRFFCCLPYHGRIIMSGVFANGDTPRFFPELETVAKKFIWMNGRLNNDFIQLIESRISSKNHFLDETDLVLIFNWSDAFIKNAPAITVLCECSNKAITDYVNDVAKVKGNSEFAVRQRWRRLGLKRAPLRFKTFRNVKIAGGEFIGFE